MAGNERKCEFCGCTDLAGCFDAITGQGCYWIEGFAGDLCSVCARVLMELEADAPVIAPEWGQALRVAVNRAVALKGEPEPFIVIADGPEADRLIREIRAGGPLS